MLWLKACPRCHGDLALAEDMYGRFVSCLQCGYILPGEEAFKLLKRPLRERVPLAPTKEPVKEAA
jgi:hypothetical protein